MKLKMKHGAKPSISSCSLSQDFLASTFYDEVDHDEEVSHTVHVVSSLFDSNAPPSIKKQILKSHIFLCLSKVIFILVILLMKNK